MKRAISLILAALLLAALFAGCTGMGLKPITQPSGETETMNQKNNESEPAKTEAPATEPPATEPPATEIPTTAPVVTEPVETETKPTAPIGTGIVGVWNYSFDFAKIVENEILGDEDDDTEMTPEQKEAVISAFGKMFEGVNILMVLDLKEDGSFVMGIDEDSVRAAADKMSANIPEAMPELLCAMFDCTLEELTEMLTAMNVSMDDMIESMGESFNPEEMLDGIETVAGNYVYEPGKLLLTPDDEDSEPVNMTVELNGNELKVIAVNGESELTDMKQLMPMIFVRS